MNAAQIQQQEYRAQVLAMMKKQIKASMGNTNNTPERIEKYAEEKERQIWDKAQGAPQGEPVPIYVHLVKNFLREFQQLALKQQQNAQQAQQERVLLIQQQAQQERERALLAAQQKKMLEQQQAAAAAAVAKKSAATAAKGKNAAAKTQQAATTAPKAAKAPKAVAAKTRKLTKAQQQAAAEEANRLKLVQQAQQAQALKQQQERQEQHKQEQLRQEQAKKEQMKKLPPLSAHDLAKHTALKEVLMEYAPFYQKKRDEMREKAEQLKAEADQLNKAEPRQAEKSAKMRSEAIAFEKKAARYNKALETITQKETQLVTLERLERVAKNQFACQIFAARVEETKLRMEKSNNCINYLRVGFIEKQKLIDAPPVSTQALRHQDGSSRSTGEGSLIDVTGNATESGPEAVSSGSAWPPKLWFDRGSGSGSNADRTAQTRDVHSMHLSGDAASASGLSDEVLKDQLKSEVLTQKTFTAIVKSFRVAGMQFVLECSVANPSNSLPTVPPFWLLIRKGYPITKAQDRQDMVQCDFSALFQNNESLHSVVQHCRRTYDSVYTALSQVEQALSKEFSI